MSYPVSTRRLSTRSIHVLVSNDYILILVMSYPVSMYASVFRSLGASYTDTSATFSWNWCELLKKDKSFRNTKFDI